MHWQKSSAPEQAAPPPRPYQGVRVKEPVKELLKRKRGSIQNASMPAAATVFFPHQSLPSYSTAGQICTDVDFVSPPLPIAEDVSLYSGWLTTQSSPTSLQPLTQWSPYPDYTSHEAVGCPYTADMLVQPMCPSYTLVGTSSVLTYAPQPLITNFAARPSTPAFVPHLDVMDQQPPLSYFPWTQPIPTLPTPSLQCQPASTVFPTPPFVPVPVSIPEPASQELEDTRKEMGALTIEKLLLQDENDTVYDLNNSLSVEGL